MQVSMCNQIAHYMAQVFDFRVAIEHYLITTNQNAFEY